MQVYSHCQKLDIEKLKKVRTRELHVDVRSLCPVSEDFYGSDTSLCNHWPFALEPTPSFYAIHFINWSAKCLFSFPQDCSLLSGFLALEALLIDMHCKKRYINV